MPRAAKSFKTKQEKAKHEASLARRRERHREKRTMEMASRAAEGQSDFEALVAAEKQRLNAHKDQGKVKAGSASPKLVTKARDNLTAAFDLMGGVPALVVWGRQNPTEFYRIWARLIPKEVAEETQTLPLETLLSKLADKESLSVAEAAFQIGEETLREAKKQVALEDLLATDTIQ